MRAVALILAVFVAACVTTPEPDGFGAFKARVHAIAAHMDRPELMKGMEIRIIEADYARAWADLDHLAFARVLAESNDQQLIDSQVAHEVAHVDMAHPGRNEPGISRHTYEKEADRHGILLLRRAYQAGGMPSPCQYALEARLHGLSVLRRTGPQDGRSTVAHRHFQLTHGDPYVCP